MHPPHVRGDEPAQQREKRCIARNPPHVRGDEPYNTGKLGKTNPESAPRAWG